MTSANTLLKNILDVKGAVVQGADFSVDAHGVKKLTVRMRPKNRSLTAVRYAADIALSMTDPVLSGPGEPSTLPASWCTSMRIPSGSDVRSTAFWLLPFHGRSTIPDSPRALI